jgi:hypothetical protein
VFIGIAQSNCGPGDRSIYYYSLRLVVGLEPNVYLCQYMYLNNINISILATEQPVTRRKENTEIRFDQLRNYFVDLLRCLV